MKESKERQVKAVQDQNTQELSPSERRRRSARYLDHETAGQAKEPPVADAARPAPRPTSTRRNTSPKKTDTHSAEKKPARDTGSAAGQRGYHPPRRQPSSGRGKSPVQQNTASAVQQSGSFSAYQTGGQVPLQSVYQSGGQIPVRGDMYQPSGQVPVQGGMYQPSGQVSAQGGMYPPGGQMPAQSGMYPPGGQMPARGGMYPPAGQAPWQTAQASGHYAPQGQKYQTASGNRVGYAPVPRQGGNPPPPAHGQGRKPANGGGKRPPSWLTRILLVLMTLAILSVVAVVVVQANRRARAEQALRDAVEPYNNLYVDGVYVDGISLGGMTREQAQNMVESNARQRSDSWSVRLTYQGHLVREIRASELSMTVDVQDAMDDAWQVGHTGTLEERREEMQAVKESHFEAFTANPSSDTSVIDGILQEISQQVYRAPRDASLATFDPSLTYPFTFNEEVVGRSLDTAPLKEAIYHKLSSMESGDIELDVRLTQPEVTVQYLREHVVALRGTATTPISHHSAENRNENIRIAFSRISGTVVNPGATFSFNNTVGQRTEKNGFLPAIEYAYGELSDGIGGGVCQASTTVYLAAVRAGMSILKREPHSREVSYIEYGKDATVYWYSNHKIDMSFKNTSDSPVYITASVQSSNTRKVNLVCVVNIYGADLGNITYDIETVETPIEAPVAPKYIKDKNAEHVTYTDEEYVYSKAQEGTLVDAYLVTYENGVAVDRRFMYTDTYDPQPEIVYVGVTARQ